MDNFVKFSLENGGIVRPLIIPAEFTNGTGVMNPSVFCEKEKIFVNVRHSGYTVYHSELNKYELKSGPLDYLAEESDYPKVKTTNYLFELDQNLNVLSKSVVDTSLLDIPPLWKFAGLEDARPIRWEGKFYLTGCRRDTTSNGVGRMELSEIIFENSQIKEISRIRIPSTGKNDTFCEKNWMPILVKPYHYVKWTNPTEVVKCIIDVPYDIKVEVVSSKQLFSDNNKMRGGSQVIPYKDGYLCLVHNSFYELFPSGRQNNNYTHKFVYWDKDWNILKISKDFKFMNNKIEFCCGMSKYKENYLISFGVQDNSSYILRVPEKILEDFIDA